MINGTHWFRSALLALLALAVLSGGGFAAGDLFDDNYSDCPHKTRMRDGEIADLTVTRDAEEEDEVNVSWAATDPTTWGLGPNAYSTRLVVILDDGGDLETQTLSLGSRKATFKGVATGTAVKVQMAVVVDTAEGDYLISDILEQRILQSLTAPSFSTGWFINGTHPCFGDLFPHLRDIPLEELKPNPGRFYYIGYNENFANYRPGTAVYNHKPETPRLRIGLAHGGENNSAREDVKFDAYVLRLIDEDGDVVPEGNDVRTVDSSSAYAPRFYAPQVANPNCPSGNYPVALNLGLHYEDGNKYAYLGRFPPSNFPERGVANRAVLASELPFSNIRVIDGDTIIPAVYQHPTVTNVSDGEAPFRVILPVAVQPPFGGEVIALVPDEHRDFPVDTLVSDRTYTIEAWAVNEDNEVISPKATLKVRPKEESPTTLGGGAQRLQDYLNVPLVFPVVVPAVTEGTLLTTVFTVLK